MNDDEDNHDNMKRQSSGEEDPEVQNSKSADEFDDNSEEEGSDETAGDDEIQCGQDAGVTSSDNYIPVTSGVDTRASSAHQTLTMVPSTDDLQCNLEVPEVPVKYRLLPSESTEEVKDQVTSSSEEKPKSIADKTAPAQTQNVKEALDDPLSSELSPTSVTQFISSIPSPAQTEKKALSVGKRNISHLQGVRKKSSFDPKKLSAVSVQKTRSGDGYNWRKYGQKQVKSPQGSRSYYRCTHADCYAKKIECSDDSNRVMEIVYKSHHSHDPPQKVNCIRGSRLASPVARVNGIDSLVSSTGVAADSVPSTSSANSGHEATAPPNPQQKESIQSDNIAETVKQENIDEPEPRKRLKKTGSSCPESPSKAEKKPKLVVHAASEVGISGDGYRWRKYGQKMVKGNPHPRNYYRCTSAGCPVRKHIERAKDNTNAAIITYKGVHDHDMPVPKKRQGAPSTPLIAAAAPTSMNALQVVKPEHVQNQESATTQWSVDKEGELKGQTLECGAEKAVDSTRTLLSIGFEIKPC